MLFFQKFKICIPGESSTTVPSRLQTMSDMDEKEKERSDIFLSMMQDNDGLPLIDENVLHKLAVRKKQAEKLPGEKPKPYTKTRVMFIECPICFSKMQQI